MSKLKYKLNLTKENDFQKDIDKVNIDSDVSFLIGENNSGKSLLLKQISSGEVKITKKEKELKYEVIYLRSDSDDILDESKADKYSLTKEYSPIKQILKSFSTKNGKFEKKVTYTFENIGIKEIDELNKQNEIIFEYEQKINLKREFQGTDSEQSGSGIGRITYLSYILDVIIKSFISKVDSKEYFKTIIKRLIHENGINGLIEVYEMSKKLNDYNIKSMIERLISAVASELGIGDIYVDHTDYEFDKDKFLKIDNEDLIISITTVLESYRMRIRDFDLIEFRTFMSQFNIELHYENFNLDEVFILIDEPEKYLHFSMHELFKKIVDQILSYSEFNIKFIFATHSERMISMFRDNIGSLNICKKIDENKSSYGSSVNYKLNYWNVFDNDFDKFVRECNEDLINYKNFNTSLNFDTFTNDYIKWLLTTKENSKMFFTNTLFFMEGFSEYYLIRSLNIIDESELIISDGIINYIIFHKLSILNERMYDGVKFIFDCDTTLKQSVASKVKINEHNKYLVDLFNERNNDFYSRGSNLDMFGTNKIKFTNHTMYFADIISQINNFYHKNVFESEYVNSIWKMSSEVLGIRSNFSFALLNNASNVLENWKNGTLKETFVSELFEALWDSQDRYRINNDIQLENNVVSYEKLIFNWEQSTENGFIDFYKKCISNFHKEKSIIYNKLMKYSKPIKGKSDTALWFQIKDSEVYKKNDFEIKYSNFFNNEVLNKRYLTNTNDFINYANVEDVSNEEYKFLFEQISCFNKKENCIISDNEHEYLLSKVIKIYDIKIFNFIASNNLDDIIKMDKNNFRFEKYSFRNELNIFESYLSEKKRNWKYSEVKKSETEDEALFIEIDTNRDTYVIGPYFDWDGLNEDLLKIKNYIYLQLKEK